MRDAGETEGDFWRDVKPVLKAESQQRRANSREQSAAMLTAAGIRFDSRNGGAHLIVQHGGVVYDFWPGTGLWQQRGSRKQQRGVHALLRAIAGGSRG